MDAELHALGAALLASSSVDDARRTLQAVAQCTQCEAGLCRVLLNGAALAWLPLLRAEEVERLWAPYVARCLPQSLSWIIEALSGCSSRAEGEELARALVHVFAPTDHVVRCLDGPERVRLLCSLPSRVSNVTAGSCPPFFEAAAFFAHLCGGGVLQRLNAMDAASLLSTIALLGHLQVVAEALLRVEKTEDAAKALALCNPQSYRRLLTLLVVGARDANHLAGLVLPTVAKDASARHVLENVLLVQTIQPRLQLLLECVSVFLAAHWLLLACS
jgi:hypothetical protein